METTNRIVIIGGGIHGVSTAYYLAQLGIRSVIIEQTRIAAAASGKAGGFLAREWGSGPTVQLHHKSYDLHQQLALDLSVTSYRQVDTLEVNGNKKGSNIAGWLDKKVSSSFMDKSTAQVTPKELTDKMLTAASAKMIDGTAAVEVLLDAAVGVERSANARGTLAVVGVKTRCHGIIPTDKVILCLGPWSGVAVEDWFQLPLPMDGVKSTSFVFSGLQPVAQEPFACFCEEDANHCHLEMYPRPNGDLYICGCGGSDHVSGDRLRPGGDCAEADLVLADARRVQAACASLRSMTSIVPDGTEPDVAQACMRPCTPDGLPVMGAVPGTEGAFISCGHNCWGILWAPVCGLAMAELVSLGAARAVDLAAFTPARYMTAAEASRGRKKESVDVGEQC